MIGEVEKDPWGLAIKIVTKKLLTRRKTPGVDNLDQVQYIVRNLFPHVEPFQRQDRSSCVVRREELFTLEELKIGGGRLKARTAPGIDGVSNEILKEVIEAYQKILLEDFNFCLREGRFFADWLLGHGCFNAYLRRSQKRDEEMCCHCDSPMDNAEHPLFVCAKWGAARDALGQEVGAELTPDTMVPLMVQSERNWDAHRVIRSHL